MPHDLLRTVVLTALALSCAACVTTPAPTPPAPGHVAAVAMPAPDAPGPLVELDPDSGAERRWSSAQGHSEPGALPPGLRLPWRELAPRLGLPALPAPDTLRAQLAQLDADAEPELLVHAWRRDGTWLVAAVLDGDATALVWDERDANPDAAREDARLVLLGTVELDGDETTRELVVRREEHLRGVGLLEHELLVVAWPPSPGHLVLPVLARLELGDAALGDGTATQPVAFVHGALVVAEHTHEAGHVVDSHLRALTLVDGQLVAAPDSARGYLFVERHDTLLRATHRAAELAGTLDVEALAVPDPAGRHHLVLVGPSRDAAALGRRLRTQLPDAVAIADGRITPFFGAVLVEPRPRENGRARHEGTTIRTLEPDGDDEDGAVEPPRRTPRSRR